jgi:EAL domain-containing protein (putative c-di-GMP-specific phosphodiesterase class I)
MSRVQGYFRHAVLVYYSEKNLSEISRSLSDQGISVRLFDGRTGGAADFAGAEIIIYLYSDGSVSCMKGFIPASFPAGVPLVAIGDLEKGEVSSLRVFDFIANINTRQSRSSFLSAEPDTQKVDGITVERLRRALDDGEFELWYQPIIDAKNGCLTGFESLVRWKNADTGEIIFPDRFIPTIESEDIVVPFGFWIIDQACRQLRSWNDRFNFRTPLRVGINLSARQFTCGVLVEKIVDIINSHGVEPSSIALEITESAFMEDMETANLMLLKMRAEKIKIYLDDFGTGFSSLSYLLHFPVDVIKIDKSFVKWMHVDEQSEEIVKSIIELAHNLKMKVVAEGVEDEDHLSKLSEFGCDLIQGYYYSKPLCPVDADAFISGSCFPKG